MNLGIAYVLGVYILVIALMCTNKFSIATCAITCAVLLELGGITTFKETWAGLLNSSTVMMAAMFIVAAGLSKTSLLKRLSRSIIKPGSSDTKIMFGLAAMVIVLVSFTNGTNSLNILLPIIYSVCKAQGRPASKFIQNAAILCQCLTGLVPIGGGAAGYMLTNQIIEQFGGIGEFTYFTNCIAKIPVALVLIPVCALVNVKIAPSFEAEEYQSNAKGVADSQLDPKKEKITLIVFAATVIGLVYMSLTKGDSAVPCLVGALLMVYFGIVKPREVPNNMGLNVIFCMVGMLPIATALVNTGGDKLIAKGLDIMLANIESPVIICSAFFLVSALLTQIMYNATVENIFRPIAIIAALSRGWSCVPFVLAVSMGSYCAMLTPMASNVTALGFNAGKYSMKQYILGGLIPFIAYYLVFTFTVPFIFHV